MSRPSFYLSLFLLFAKITAAQPVAGMLQFAQGAKYTISVEVKNTITQQAMGQAIDFNINGAATHTYTVTNSTAENTTLHHDIQRLGFQFEGMGQKRAFDSDNKKDMDGPNGKFATEMLSKSYDIIIDSSGKTLMARPEKVEMAKQDDRVMILTDMLKDLTNIVYPPLKGAPSFFGILPDHPVVIGDTWSETRNTDLEKATTVNTLAAVNDSVIVVNFKTNSTTILKSQRMGMDATTNL
ncbi:MAG TPA: DUF6263 family protein, partial [Chitinophagaceae bacterium]|nr:DUF6263 family protein [Chitinophagaceae bacterium]